MVDDLSLAFNPFTKKRDDFIAFSSLNGVPGVFGCLFNRLSLGMAFIHGLRLFGFSGCTHESEDVLYFVRLTFFLVLVPQYKFIGG